MNNIHICMASDNSYVSYMGTAMTSILVNSKYDYITFHIIDGGISKKNKDKLFLLQDIKEFDIEFYIPDKKEYRIWFDKLENKGHFSEAMFYRLSIPYLIKDIDKILYLDSDIVVNNSLTELFNMDITSYYLIASKRSKKQNLSLLKEKSRLGLMEKDVYFNSGMLLINSKLWRDNNIFNAFSSFVDKIDNLIYGDQHILNVVFKDKIKIIDEEYNFLSHKSSYDYTTTIENISIIHYITDEKPWREYCPNILFKELWWKYFFLTPWFQENPWKYINTLIEQKINDMEIRIVTVIENDKKSIEYKMDKIIDSIVWLIPIKKWRDNFRNKFK